MANPPANRRPGVDADVFQGEWIHGYDVPAGDQTLPPLTPCDLLISNGKSAIDGSLSNTLIWSRTDLISQPMFVLVQGTDYQTPEGTINFHIGREEDPNGLITDVSLGSLYASYGIPGLWQLSGDGVTWVKISDDLGGENLAETLAIGNFTGGSNIVLTTGDILSGEDDALGVGGGPVVIRGGAELAALGDGGSVSITSGTSVGGVTGILAFASAAAASASSSGAVSFQSGVSQLGAPSGSVTIASGTAGNVGFAGSGGSVFLSGGRSRASGAATSRGGNVFVSGGQGTSQGEGGTIRISAGISSDSDPINPIPGPSAGKGGDILVDAGSSSGAITGGQVRLAAGTGGPAGALGGNIVLAPGAGGGGFDDGIVNATGIFQSDNIKRGAGNPNGVIAGNEGDVFQRIDAGIGEIYLNVNGTINGWQKLAFAGDFIESYEQMNWGYLSRSGRNQSGLEVDNFAAHGVLKGLAPNNVGTGLVNIGGVLDSGPLISFEAVNNGDVGGVDFSAGSGTLPTATRQQFILTFRARNIFPTANRIFMGVSSLDLPTQVSSIAPVGGYYLGFVLDPALSTWRVVTNDSLGATILDTGISGVTTSSATDTWFWVIDATQSGIGVIRFFIFNNDLDLQSSISAVASLPPTAQVMGTVIGVTKTAADGQNKRLEMVSASLVNDANLVGQGGGNALGQLSLAQVLINGNETGSNPILVNQASGGLLGVTDDNAGDGASFGIFGGATTLAGNDTGSVSVTSGSAFGGGALNAGTQTGDVLFASGNQLQATAQSDTGDVLIQTGDHLGTDGETGTVSIRTGGFTNAAAGTRTQGDILIAPGSFAPGTATVTGEVIVKGGSSTVVGVTGGDVTLTSGENSSASGNTGSVFIESFPVNQIGNSGTVEIRSGLGGSNTGNSGDVILETGNAPGIGNSGAFSVTTGNAATGIAGSIQLLTGTTTSGVGTDLTIQAGDTTDGGQIGGSIILNPGTGPGGDGEVLVNGKLTVTGLIDPTGLLLDGQLVAPVVVGAGQGLLYVSSTVVPSQLIYVDDSGTPHNISTGGGVTTLAALSDVNLSGLAPGQVLTFNGVEWVNLAGFGGSPLSTILAIGNSTGALPIVINDSLGSSIVSDGDLVLNPGAGVSDAVVIDGLRWPQADGVAGYVLTTNGLGGLSFQPGGGGVGSTTFADAFAQMQWGSLFPPPDTGVPSELNGAGILHGHSDTAPGGSATLQTAQGLTSQMTGIQPNVAEAGFITSSAITRRDNLGQYTWKFSISNTADVRMFLGLTDGTRVDMVNTDAPITPTAGYAGLGYSTNVPDAGFVFWYNNAAGAGVRAATGVVADTNVHYFVLDASIPGQLVFSLYDQDYVLESQSVVVATLPAAALPLLVMGALIPLGGAAESINLYSCSAVHRADLLGALGGGGNQDLFSVLGFGNETNGLPIKGSDNAGGAGQALELEGGSSTGGLGAGGDVTVTTGSPDAAGNGASGDFQLSIPAGAGTGAGGSITLASGDGGATGGAGGSFTLNAGDGMAAGNGGTIVLTAGDSGIGSLFPGVVTLQSGSGTGGNTTGGRIRFVAGDGFGSGAGGVIQFEAGDGGVGGDGGGFLFIPGTGGGVDGEFIVQGDAHITGKLTVDGMIDPPGLLMSSSLVVPFTPAGTEGGIWVNAAGELVYTNLGGDLNLSTAIGGGMGFLEAFLTAGYGFLGAGNPSVGVQSYGVYGSSSIQAVTPGPPPASITFSEDTDGPFLNLAVAANPSSEAFLGTADLFIRRSQQFRARFKFQSTSPAHTNERVFIGFTTDGALVTPSTQLSADDPVTLEYVGIRESLAGVNLEFVARGSGGAMVPVFAIPTDALVHYFEVDATDAGGDVTFRIFAADGITEEASHTEPSSLLLPDLAISLRPFSGIFTDIGATPRGLDFYFSSVITRADVVEAVVLGGGVGGTPTLEAVLASGNLTGVNPILVDSSIAGNTVDLDLSGGTGGAGLPGTVSIGASVGDDGGAINVAAGNGAGAAGIGGLLQFTAGNGAGTGSGAAIQIDGGDGGIGGGNGGAFQASAGDALGGNGAGGAVTISSGAGDGSGDGGLLQLAGGAGGSTTGDGGGILLVGGSPAAGTGLQGGIRILAGAAAAPISGEGFIQIVSSPHLADANSSAYITASAATGILGAGVALQAGRAVPGTGGDGGLIRIVSAAGDGAGVSGRIHILAEGATPITVPGGGGDIQLVGRGIANARGGFVGVTSGAAASGGVAAVTGGDGILAGAAGGDVSILGGEGGAGADNGGAVSVQGGTGGATGDGGDVVLGGGNTAGGANFGGNVRLIPGTGPGGDGTVSIEGTLNSSASGLQFGTFAIPGVGSHLVAFGAAFPTAPRNIQLTIEATSVALGGAGNDYTVTITPGLITATDFTITVFAVLAAPGPVTLHWLALL